MSKTDLNQDIEPEYLEVPQNGLEENYLDRDEPDSMQPPAFHLP